MQNKTAKHKLVGSTLPWNGGTAAHATAVVSCTVSPTSATVSNAHTQQFTATITGGGLAVWSVQGGGAGGTVDQTGLYTAPALSVGTDHVKVHSDADGSAGKTATATITLSA